jgi:predicted exporter
VPSRIERWLPRGFQLSALLLILLGAWLCRNGWPISADLLELLPGNRGDAVQAEAQARSTAPLSRDLVALVGAAEPAQAVGLARQTAAAWRQTGLFEYVMADVSVDLPAIRQQLLDQRLAMLPPGAARQLADDPVAFVEARAAELGDPFSSAGAVPLASDWLGLAHRAEQGQIPPGAVSMDLATGTLQAERDGKTWVLLHARSLGGAFDQRTPERIAQAVATARAGIAAAHGEMLVAGGALYAAAGREQAVKESTRLGAVAAIGIVLLMLLSLRRVRSLLALLPALFGLLCAVVTCVAVFGKIHVMTLVVGASLIGVASDFPMHWLGKSYGMPDWQAWPAMRRVLPGLTISLGASLVGYLALAFTPFPALTQTAIFSAAGLLGAYACTVCQLPALFRGCAPRPWAPLAAGASRLLAWRARAARARALPWLLLAAAILAAGGIWQLRVQDDLRLWISVPRPLLDEARRIGEITGFMPTSQFFLVRAPDEENLLARQADIGRRLQPLVLNHALSGYTALDQLVAPASEQSARRAAVAALAARPGALDAYARLGLPAASLDAEIGAISRLPTVDIDHALAGPLGERWRGLWLGRQADGTVAGMVTLSGLSNADALEAVAAAVPDTSLIDRTGELNRSFAATRVEAAELKALSYAIAALILWLAFGRRATVELLAVPLAATAASLAVLGYTGQPLTMFSLFGLLLVSAIGVDYAIFMYEAVAGASASLIGIGLAGAFTLLSFGLLALSQTPAIANFGLAVTLGVLFSLLFAPWVRPLSNRKEPNGK